MTPHETLRNSLDLLGPEIEELLEKAAGQEAAFTLIIHPFESGEPILRVTNTESAAEARNILRIASELLQKYEGKEE